METSKEEILIESNLTNEGIKSSFQQKDKSELNENEKSRLLKLILIAQVVCGTQYLNVMSFFPLFVE